MSSSACKLCHLLLLTKAKLADANKLAVYYATALTYFSQYRCGVLS